MFTKWVTTGLKVVSGSTCEDGRCTGEIGEDGMATPELQRIWRYEEQYRNAGTYHPVLQYWIEEDGTRRHGLRPVACAGLLLENARKRELKIHGLCEVVGKVDILEELTQGYSENLFSNKTEPRGQN